MSSFVREKLTVQNNVFVFLPEYRVLIKERFLKLFQKPLLNSLHIRLDILLFIFKPRKSLQPIL